MLLPSAFEFDVPAGHDSFVSFVVLHNPTPFPLQFSVKVDNAKLLRCKPSKGLIRPREDLALRFTLTSNQGNNGKLRALIVHSAIDKNIQSEIAHSYRLRNDSNAASEINNLGLSGSVLSRPLNNVDYHKRDAHNTNVDCGNTF